MIPRPRQDDANYPTLATSLPPHALAAPPEAYATPPVLPVPTASRPAANRRARHYGRPAEIAQVPRRPVSWHVLAAAQAWSVPHGAESEAPRVGVDNARHGTASNGNRQNHRRQQRPHTRRRRGQFTAHAYTQTVTNRNLGYFYSSDDVPVPVDLNLQVK